MTYQTEFPTFDPATMPAMPDGFVDNSWGNDMCPNFILNLPGLRWVEIWVDFANPEDREFIGEEAMPRFAVRRGSDEIHVGLSVGLRAGESARYRGDPDPADADWFFQSDDFAAILAEVEKEKADAREKAEGRLTAAYTAFLKRAGLEEVDAEEALLVCAEKPPGERSAADIANIAWLTRFIEIWRADVDRAPKGV